MPQLWLLLGWACLCTKLVRAEDIVYVTDLSIFTVLAPCAATAISENVQAKTNDNCPEAVTDLQSCVCTKDNNFASISSGISKSISWGCGSTASEDQTSAASVFSAYCNQASITPFPTPTNPVTQYITDFPAWRELAPCAASGLSYIVQSLTYELCNAEASLLATCACDKNQNSLRVSQSINTSVKYSCSSHTADIDSAQAVFAGYCGLVHGTSSFPTTSNPPGDMTYYITALPEFSSLASCAQDAVSTAVMSQTYDFCPSGPEALASCVCIKSTMSGHVSNQVGSDVTYHCDSTATEDLSSARRVFDMYCSAAKGLTTLAGITESVQQTSAYATSGTSGPKETSVTSGVTSAEGPVESEGSTTNSASKSNVGTIVGAAVGAVAGSAMLGLIAFFFWRRSRLNRGYDKAVPLDSAEGFAGKPELDGAVLASASAISPGFSTSGGQAASMVDNVSPVSAPSSPYKPELQGHNPPQYSHIPELHDQNQNTYSIHEAQGQPRSELPGMGWQSGPVAEFHELDSNYRK
ncbi:uncharacterized protein GGS22DRAFT_185654 [Annulohypoxylon maeteangense]|uniref:uncharacterized protein n=1 Tax=Annulohypoxylon maeteangense TaxID=1927788 RepID=UPI0020083654|nr:uncharacterized protein GGS22DRAFT_185654 [Annulohypoxylon maeteangense]KAI0888276.1 hypothetical protein GGS22DRAFT_185654 [Annulohypoxylon maeteangense]